MLLLQDYAHRPALFNAQLYRYILLPRIPRVCAVINGFVQLQNKMLAVVQTYCVLVIFSSKTAPLAFGDGKGIEAVQF